MKLAIVLSLAAALTQGTALAVKREVLGSVCPDNRRMIACCEGTVDVDAPLVDDLSGLSCSSRRCNEPGSSW